MLKRSWALIALVYLVLAEALSLIPVPDLALCLIQPEHGQQATNHDNPKYCPAFHTGAALVFERTDHFLETHDKSVVGGFTIVLAISTIGLWLATNKLWAAGEKQFGLLSESAAAQSRDMQASIAVADKAASAAAAQAHIVVKTERPYIFVIPLNEGGSPFDPERKVSYFVRNYGRTPAIIETIIMGLRIIPDFNAPPDYADLFKGETRMVAPETSPEIDRLPSEYNKRKPFKPEELAAVARGDAKMCLIGLIKYRSIHNDFLKTGFCFEYISGTSSWNVVGGEKYNYET